MISFELEDAGFEDVKEFERLFADFLGVRHAIAVCSGTMADTVAIAVIKNLYATETRNEVLVPAQTSIAHVNAILYNNLRPVFYDRTYEVTENTLCVFPVHLLGKPQYVHPTVPQGDRLVPVIEDACEALGSSIYSFPCGTMGLMGTFSFFVTHTLSTGEGGMVVTDSDECADLARRLRNHASIGQGLFEKFHFDMVGFNAKMSRDAALRGIVQMSSLSAALKQRNTNYLLLGGKQESGEYIVPHGLPVCFDTESARNEAMQRFYDA